MSELLPILVSVIGSIFTSWILLQREMIQQKTTLNLFMKQAQEKFDKLDSRISGIDVEMKEMRKEITEMILEFSTKRQGP